MGAMLSFVRALSLAPLALGLLVGCGDVKSQQRPDAAVNPPVDALLKCVTGADCDDGQYCNGIETCEPENARANALGCVAGESPCSVDQLCDPTPGACVNRCEFNPDLDGDGEHSTTCGGRDCDDNNAAVSSTATEICDAFNGDEDCNPNTVGGKPGYWKHCTACDLPCSTQQVCESSACAAGRRVFITSTTYTANFGGVAGADAACRTRAAAANLGGEWKAYLTTNGVTIASRHAGAAVPYVRLDGVRIADSFADLTDGTIQAPLNITELHTVHLQNAWTGMSSPTTGNNNDCVGWTSEAFGCLQGGPCGHAGQSDHTNDNWDGAFVFHCSQRFALYCIEQ
jgi:hypothetical protein